MTELSAVTIGDNVKAQIDFGADLPSSMKMTINSCYIGGDASNLYFITDGLVMTELSEMVQIVETTSNRLAEFTWRVFTNGSGARITISCQVKVIKTVTTEIENVTTPSPSSIWSTPSDYYEYLETTADECNTVTLIGPGNICNGTSFTNDTVASQYPRLALFQGWVI